jgi:predicted nucleic acid-binding protein
LESGIQQSQQPEHLRRTLRDHLRTTVRVWPLDPPIARLYGEIYNDLQRRGRALSQVDMMLVALSRMMNLTLLTSDRDFEALPDIRTENWLI